RGHFCDQSVRNCAKYLNRHKIFLFCVVIGRPPSSLKLLREKMPAQVAVGGNKSDPGGGIFSSDSSLGDGPAGGIDRRPSVFAKPPGDGDEHCTRNTSGPVM